MMIGQLICENCGKNCNKLWGFMLGVRGQIRDQQQQKELAEVKKEFGKEEFVWCWSCTAKMFGAKTLAQKEAEALAQKETETQAETQTADSADKVTFETGGEEKPPVEKTGFFGRKSK
ncbi:MAG: hypothetical protein MUP81_03160 [Dehalococcoidia bacterium]|nr:hypothetical protein [Dehalococcoidia bacterium]